MSLEVATYCTPEAREEHGSSCSTVIFKCDNTYSYFIVILNTKELAHKDPAVIFLDFFVCVCVCEFSQN